MVLVAIYLRFRNFTPKILDSYYMTWLYASKIIDMPMKQVCNMSVRFMNNNCKFQNHARKSGDIFNIKSKFFDEAIVNKIIDTAIL